MRKKMLVVFLLGVLLITLMPSIYAENIYRKDTLYCNDPPFWEGTVTLIKKATFKVNAPTSGKTYTVFCTTALGALDRASRRGNFGYTIDDQWYDQFGSLLVDSIAEKEGGGFDGWQYWVNYPNEPIPYVGVDQYQVKEGDVVDFFYGGFDLNPDTATMLIRIYIHIEEDTSPPLVDIVRPIGGIYILDREIITLPVDVTIIIGKISILVEAKDELTNVSRIEFFVDDQRQGIDKEYPYEWTCDETSFGRHTLLVIAYDSVGNYGYGERILWILSN
jgi:hypothetical protein